MAWLAPLGVALCLALGPAGSGSGPVTQSLRLRVPPDISDLDHKTLTQRFDEGLSRSGLDHRPAPERANDCADAECYRSVAQTAGTSVFVGGTIQKTGPDYSVEVYAIDGNTGDTVASVDGVCEICGVGELGDVVSALAARLRPALENNTQPAVLIVDSEPSNAEVWVDAEMVGTTPLQTNVTPGPHQVDVIKRGRRTKHVEYEARPGIKESYSFRLARSTALPGWVPWAFLGGGVASLGTGITLLAIDERPIRSDCNPDSIGNCEFLYDTLAGGVVFTVVGVGLVGAGVGLILRQRQQDKIQRSGVTSRLRLVPGLGGASLVGRF